MQTSGLGFQVFNATNDTIMNRSKTEEFLRERYPKMPITREMGEIEAPLPNAKIQRLLGFREKHDWKKYFRLWEKENNQVVV